MNIAGNLLRISHKNKLNYFDNESLLELKENVYSYLESLGEVNNNDAIKYFQKKKI